MLVSALIRACREVLSLRDELLEAAGSNRIGRCMHCWNHENAGCTRSVAPLRRRLEMYQQPNVNETLPSQGEAINKLHAEHYEASLRTAKRILRSKEDSEDAVQTAYFA